ncbi:unnamed protein product [Larinioides sclopetarius]|uniref:Uncharacterized protein n=1 Tax=Larinioides sclopetarius TaxID=280406 RepID=A0AAV2BB73_9ARAC
MLSTRVFLPGVMSSEDGGPVFCFGGGLALCERWRCVSSWLAFNRTMVKACKYTVDTAKKSSIGSCLKSLKKNLISGLKSMCWIK